MADVRVERRGINSERWAELVAYFSMLQPEPLEKPEDVAEITLDTPTEIGGWVYMPAAYFPA